MRRWIILLTAAAVAAMLPSQGRELGNLRPAAVLRIGQAGREIFAETDMGDRGVGETLEKALFDLKRTAPGTVFLDTVQYLLVDEETKYTLPQLRSILRPTVRLCITEGNADLGAAEVYLRQWKPKGTIEQPAWQKLIWDGERFYLEA